MKTLIIKSILLSLLATGLWSCKKDETKTVATAGTGGVLASSVSALVLDKTMLNTNVITFSIGAADFGYPAILTTTLQAAVKGKDFAANQTKEFILDPKASSKGYNGLDFNNLLLSLNLPTATSSDVEFRLKSSISTATAPVFSNVVTLSAKPFPLTAWIYVPGAYQGWNILTADSLISPTGNGVYTGIIAFTPGNLEFKLAPAKNWNLSYGDAGSGKLSTSGGNFKATQGGSSQVTADLNAKTWTITPIAWSIIGNAVPGSNWFVDSDLKYINDGKGLWTITTNLTPGELKFRKNHDWTTSIGNGAGNIAITTAGNYTLNLSVNADGKTGTYTLTKN